MSPELPNKSELKDYLETALHSKKSYDITVDKQGVVTLKSYFPASIL
jgi:hypothetical protein